MIAGIKTNHGRPGYGVVIECIGCRNLGRQPFVHGISAARICLAYARGRYFPQIGGDVSVEPVER